MKLLTLRKKTLADENGFIREAFNTIRANLLFSGNEVKTIVVTSCFANEGKTSVTVDLCRALAADGKKVLMIDADLRKSVIVSRYTEEKGVKGLSQYLSGQATLDEVLYQFDPNGVDVIFSGPFPPNPTELIGSRAFRELLASQRDNYDYILIDMAPLGIVIDAAIAGSVCDGAVMVISSGHVRRKVAVDVKNQLEKSGCRLLGVVLNQIDKKSLTHPDSYYSSYGGRYGYGYKSAYGSNPSKSESEEKPEDKA